MKIVEGIKIVERPKKNRVEGMKIVKGIERVGRLKRVERPKKNRVGVMEKCRKLGENYGYQNMSHYLSNNINRCVVTHVE